MAAETAAIILCAGMGSRMGLPDSLNKCAAPIGGACAARHTAASLAVCGVKRIIIVTGHAEASIKSALEGFGEKCCIQFVYNPYYAFHGCNYSLACGANHAGRPDRLIIAEGDSLLHPDLIAQVLSTEADAVSLVRPDSYLDFSRSVIAIGRSGKITRYAYNMHHTNSCPQLADGENVMGESMQIWSFSGNVLNRLLSLLHQYSALADADVLPMTESGVYSINQLACEITPIQAALPECWFNLNTPNDFMKAGSVQWLKR